MDKSLVLFLCSGNSVRSQMAEALLRHLAGDRFRAASAGLDPKPIDPMTLQVLEERGVSTNGLRSKGVEEFLGKEAVRHAIVVCDISQTACPKFFPFSPDNIRWPFEDPASFVGSVEGRRAKFRAVRDQIEEQIRLWLGETATDSGSTQ